jgi:hypothetical protein
VVTGLLPDAEPLEDEPDDLLVRVVTGLDAFPEPDDVGWDPLVVCLTLVRVVTAPGLDAAAVGPAAIKW